jgi:hypothetical protein
MNLPDEGQRLSYQSLPNCRLTSVRPSTWTQFTTSSLSFGGARAIVFGLSKSLGKVWANRLKKRERRESEVNSSD